MELLRIEHLSAGIEDKELLHSFLLTVGSGSLLIITHNAKILEALDVDRTHIIADGRIMAEGGAEVKRCNITEARSSN